MSEHHAERERWRFELGDRAAAVMALYAYAVEEAREAAAWEAEHADDPTFGAGGQVLLFAT